MVLSDIKRYLQDRKQVTLDDLAIHFDTDREAMRGMLTTWIRKDRVVRCDLQATCGKGCSACSCEGAMELYEWKEGEPVRETAS